MKMRPESQNIFVMPSHVRKMSGKPGKNRKKEEGEIKKKNENLFKKGIEMSCNTCHNNDHNKRKCPKGSPVAGTNVNLGPSSSAGAVPSAGLSSSSSASPTVGQRKRCN